MQSNEAGVMLLAVDTSSGGTSVALWRAGGLLAARHDAGPGGQSRLLVPMIEAVLTDAGQRYADCDAVAATLGPGGFTSIRVGLATARAVALAAGLPFIGLSSLEVMAWAYLSQQPGHCVAATSLPRGQWAMQRFRGEGELKAPEALSPPVMGDDAALHALGHGAHVTTTPSNAQDLSALAALKWQCGERDFAQEPIYLRPPDAVPPPPSPYASPQPVLGD